MGYVVSASTDAGLVKKTNQDAFCYLVASTSVGPVLLAAVFDGVGGMNQGELASSTLAKAFTEWFKEDFPYLLEDDAASDLEPIRQSLLALLDEQNETLYHYGETTGNPLASTCTCLLTLGGQYVIANVGDCRVYEIWPHGLRVLTEDQTYVMSEVKAGRMTLDEARFHPQRNVILQAIGAQPDLEPDSFVGQFDNSAVYMLCCDGFRTCLEEDEICEAFQKALLGNEAGIKDVIDNLVDLVKARGERDNITAIALFEEGSAGIGEVLHVGGKAENLIAENSDIDEDDRRSTVVSPSTRKEDEISTVVGRLADDDATSTVLGTRGGSK